MKKKIIPVITVLFLIIVVILFMLLGKVIDQYTPTTERQELAEYYAISNDSDVAIILNNITTQYPIRYNIASTTFIRNFFFIFKTQFM